MNDLVLKASQEHKSKFEKYGAEFRCRIEAFLNDPNLGGTRLHRYQIKAVLAVRKMIMKDPPGNTKPCLVVSPNGSGKSAISVMLPYVLEAKKVLLLTPHPLISDRLAEEFGSNEDKSECFFIKTGLVQPINASMIKDYCENVQVISRSSDIIGKTMGNLVIVNVHKFAGKSKATLSIKFRNEVVVENVRKFFAKFDTLIVDEAHQCPAQTWQLIVKEWKQSSSGTRKNLVFLAATPYRMNNKKKIHILSSEGGESRVAYAVKREECIGESIKEVRFDINKIGHENFAKDLIETLRVQYQVEPRFKPQAMVLAKNRDHVGKCVTTINRSAGKVIAVGISGDSHTIKSGLKMFNAGIAQVAVTCKVGLEGYNNTRVTLCVILRRIVTGINMFSQFVGRCMRIRRPLPVINGVEVTDRSYGKVISYKVYELEVMKNDYESLDEFVSSHGHIE